MVPPWVRHFSREVLANQEAALADPAAFGARRYERPQRPTRHPYLWLGAFALGVFLYCFGLVHTSYEPGTSAPIPCYGGPGLEFFSRLSHAVTGKLPLGCPAP